MVMLMFLLRSALRIKCITFPVNKLSEIQCSKGTASSTVKIK